jgi:hypothetical protein
MLDWLLDVTFITAGTDILLLAIVVLPLGFAALLWARRGADETTERKACADWSAPDNERIGRDIIDSPSSGHAQAARQRLGEFKRLCASHMFGS